MLPHLPAFVYILGYIILGAIVLLLLVLAVVKIRNARMYGGK